MQGKLTFSSQSILSLHARTAVTVDMQADCTLPLDSDPRLMLSLSEPIHCNRQSKYPLGLGTA